MKEVVLPGAWLRSVTIRGGAAGLALALLVPLGFVMMEASGVEASEVEASEVGASGANTSAGVLPAPGSALPAKAPLIAGAPRDGEGRFQNLPGSPKRPEGGWDFAKFFMRRVLFSSSPDIPADHVLAEESVRAGLAASGGSDAVTWIGHATFLLRINGTTILTDPFFSDYASPFAPLGPRRYVPAALGVGDLPPVDVVIVSHNHYDQLDGDAVSALARQPGIRAVVPLNLGGFFRDRGFQGVSELDWGESVTIGTLEITAVPAVHWSRRGLFDSNRSLWAGYVLAARDPSRRVYFSGDTGYHPRLFKEIGDRFGPMDLAIIGIGAYTPRSLMAAHHITPEEAVEIGRDVGARRLLGMHWGTVVLTDTPAFEPPRRFREAAAKAGFGQKDVWVFRIGETRPLLPVP